VGFDAYGTSQQSMDPVASAIHGLIEHIQMTDKRVDVLCQTIQRLGGEIPDFSMPELEGCELDKQDKSTKVD